MKQPTGKAGFAKLKQKGFQQRTLPNRGAMNDLANSDRNIMNYAKATPMTDTAPSALTTMFMAQKQP